MRATLFFILLSSLFLFNRTHAVINKAHFYSVSNCLSQKQIIVQPCSLDNSVDYNKIIEESDLDSSEDKNTEFQKTNKICSLNTNLVKQWEIEFLGLALLKNDSKGFKNCKPYTLYSNPIYILQGVLRI